jgi:hypothetical protein
MSLIDVHDFELETDRRAPRELAEEVQHRVAVLAAAHADHDAIALGEHLEVRHRAPEGSRQASFRVHQGRVAALVWPGKPLIARAASAGTS